MARNRGFLRTGVSRGCEGGGGVEAGQPRQASARIRPIRYRVGRAVPSPSQNLRRGLRHPLDATPSQAILGEACDKGVSTAVTALQHASFARRPPPPRKRRPRAQSAARPKTPWARSPHRTLCAHRHSTRRSNRRERQRQSDGDRPKPPEATPAQRNAVRRRQPVTRRMARTPRRPADRRLRGERTRRGKASRPVARDPRPRARTAAEARRRRASLPSPVRRSRFCRSS